MATKVNVITNINGIQIPSGLVIQNAVHFPAKELSRDENDNLVVKVYLKVDLIPFANKQTYQDSLGKGNLGKVDEIPSSYSRELSASDFSALSGANAFEVVETWIKDYLETFVGEGNCELIDLTN